MKNGYAAGRLVLSVLLVSGAVGQLAAGEAGLVGRVRVSVVEDDALARAASLETILESRMAPSPGRAFADQRLISVRPREDDPDRFDATLYDYTAEEAFDVIFDASGAEISRTSLLRQPGLAEGELEDAMSILALDATLSAAISAGDADLYAPMPPVVTGDDGARLVNVGIRRRGSGQPDSGSNEIVSVHIPTGRVTRYAASAPPTSLATLANCGPNSSNCGAGSGSCATYHYEWPAASPVWKFDLLHPSCTRSVQSDGTGLELQNVRYRDHLVLARADMPVLNVKYVGDACGPYRDWLFTEDCFQATGTTVSPGVIVAGATAPTSFCDTNTDAGVFRGVAIQDEGSLLRLVTETQAGWYRYVMEWRLHLDGTIEPVFGFGAVSNSCTCTEHTHHAYWRFEFALDGVTGNAATGICTLDRRTPGTSTQWTAVSTEGSFVRPPSNPASDSWRVRNPATGTTYEIDPGANDGSASGDSYAKADVWALAANSNEIDDSETDTSIRIDPWVNGEALGASKRLVLWYGAGYDHDHDTTGDACHLVGPTLHFQQTCPAIVTLDRGTYGCSDGIAVTVEDDDLIGAGTLSVTARSATESGPESIVLHETPAGSGKFSGTVPTRPAPAVAGDGKISVVDGDTVTVSYLDVSSCGTPNVTVAQTASIDCTVSLVVSSQTVSPTCSAGGAPDATVDPGEIVTLQVVARNAGGAPATGVSGSITTTTPGVTVLDATASFPDLASGASAASLTPFRLAVGSSVPCATTIALSLRFTSNEGSWTRPVELLIGAVGGAPVSRSWSSTDTPKPLPDFPVTTTSTIHVVDPGTVTDVNVPLEITHTYDGDLDIFLIGPNGTRVELTTDNGLAGLGFTGTIFDDEAATSIVSGTPPYTGSFRPETPLAALDGAAIAGDWTLESTDDGAGDVGTLQSWSIAVSALEPVCSSCAPARPTQEASLVRFTSRTVLEWNAAPGATWYEIDRGTGPSLPALLTSAADSCRLAGSGTTSPAVVSETPAVGSFYWYLVIPASTGGLGPAGAATAGPRLVDSTGDCP